MNANSQQWVDLTLASQGAEAARVVAIEMEARERITALGVTCTHEKTRRLSFLTSEMARGATLTTEERNEATTLAKEHRDFARIEAAKAAAIANTETTYLTASWPTINDAHPTFPATIPSGGEGGGLSEAQVDARADARIAAWVGAAPGALDTLTEIATALGDDQTAIDGLTSAIAGKADAAHTHAQADVTGLVAALAGKASSTHSHAISDTTGLQAALDGKQASGSYAAASHAHVIADTTGLQAALDGKQASGSYAAASHTHAQADVTNLVSDLAGKASTSHNHDGVYQPLATALTNTTAAFTTEQETKLSGIATGATANSADATLLSRGNHTGTQTAATISDFSTAADARIAAASVNALADVTVTAPGVGQVLKWNGSAWVNDTDATGAGGGGTNGYAIAVQALTSTMADAATIYFGMLPKAPITTANVSKVYIRAAGTIKRAEIYCYSGTAGTGESWSLYIRKNNTTDTLIATVAAATNERVFTNAALNIAVASGDYIEIKSVNPTWATNPATCIFGGYIYIEA